MSASFLSVDAASNVPAKRTELIAVLNGLNRRLDTVSDPRELCAEIECAELLRTLVRTEKLGLDAQNKVGKHRLRVRRKLGTELAELSEKRRALSTGNRLLPPEQRIPTLKELGISKMQSFRFQREASIPFEQFEEYVRETCAAGEEVTAAGLRRLAPAADFGGGNIRSDALNPVLDPPRSPLRSPGDSSEQQIMTDPGHLGPDIFQSIEELIQSGRRFRTVHADPPWPYDNVASRGAAENHYPTLTVDEICDLPVAKIAAESAHLHLWTTNSFLPVAFRVIEAWDFEYKSACVWVKPQMGMGNYWRISHEVCLFATRGNAPFLCHDFLSWFEADRRAHSQKPEEMRHRIEVVNPGPFLELFARRSAPGWTTVGNQLTPQAVVHPEDAA